ADRQAALPPVLLPLALLLQVPSPHQERGQRHGPRELERVGLGLGVVEDARLRRGLLDVLQLDRGNLRLRRGDRGKRDQGEAEDRCADESSHRPALYPPSAGGKTEIQTVGRACARPARGYGAVSTTSRNQAKSPSRSSGRLSAKATFAFR